MQKVAEDVILLMIVMCYIYQSKRSRESFENTQWRKVKQTPQMIVMMLLMMIVMMLLMMIVMMMLMMIVMMI